jgi:hypothetical protein
VKTLGGILLGIGILIAGLSGLCSLVFFATEITSPYTKTGDLIAMLLGFGGIPFAIGLGLIFLGRHFTKLAGKS